MIFQTMLTKLPANVSKHWRLSIALPIVCVLFLLFALSIFWGTTSTFAATISTKGGSHTHASPSTHTPVHPNGQVTGSSSSRKSTGTTTTSHSNTSHQRTT